MPVEIREVTATPDAKGWVVRLQISDAPLRSESVPTFHLDLTALVPAYEMPLVAHLERAALKVAQEELTRLLQERMNAISGGNYERDPPVKRPRRT